MFNAEIIKRREMPGVPAASALEIHRDVLFVVGDNSRYLFCLDMDGKQLASVPLYAGTTTATQPISKQSKADLEASALIVAKDGVDIIFLGSGSLSPQRERAYKVHAPNQCFEQVTTASWKELVKVNEFSLSKLYKDLRGKIGSLVAERDIELNIEAATVVSDKLVLFHRDVNGHNNLMISYPLDGFLAWSGGGKASLPVAELKKINLPSVDNVATGFSGATFNTQLQEILFCASAEATTNAIDDGIVKGSIIGRLVTSEASKKGEASEAVEWARVTENGKAVSVKIESVAMAYSKSENQAIIKAVTDSDGGVSELLEICLKET